MGRSLERGDTGRCGGGEAVLYRLNRVKSTSPEQKTVLIIDQLEEIYTNPDTTGATEVAQISNILFKTMNESPQYSVVLSFREEFLNNKLRLLLPTPHFSFHFARFDRFPFPIICLLS